MKDTTMYELAKLKEKLELERLQQDEIEAPSNLLGVSIIDVPDEYLPKTNRAQRRK